MSPRIFRPPSDRLRRKWTAAALAQDEAPHFLPMMVRARARRICCENAGRSSGVAAPRGRSRIHAVDELRCRWFHGRMMPPPDLSRLTEAEKDTLILALWAQVQALTARVAHLEGRLNEPTRTSSNSSLPPSKGHKANRPERERRAGPRRGSLGRAGGGRPLSEEPDQFVIAKAAACAHCRAALGEADQRLHARYDKVELPPVRPVVTRVERYLGRCPCRGGATLAPVPEGTEQGTPFGVSILALALYLRFTHAISYRRLTRLFLHLFALPISEGALDALFRRAKPRFDDAAAAILARLRANVRGGGGDSGSEAARRSDPHESGVGAPPPRRSGGHRAFRLGSIPVT